jgi:hypothetical protein
VHSGRRSKRSGPPSEHFPSLERNLRREGGRPEPGASILDAEQAFPAISRAFGSATEAILPREGRIVAAARGFPVHERAS